MKKVLGTMSKFIFGAFAIAVLGLLMSLTYSALQRLFPDSFSNQMWGLVMFDIAAMCWALAFVFQSKSVGQYAAAGIGFITAFVGTLLMVAAEVMLSGQALTQADTSQIGKWMTYGFIIVTALHAALVYTHHATAPDIHEQINVGVARGEIVTEAISQATKTLEVQKAELAETIHRDIVSQVKRDLGLYPVTGTPFDKNRFNLDVNMPPEEWQDLEKELQEKGYLEHSNIPAPLTIETKKRTQRKARPWLKNIMDKFKTPPQPIATYETTAPQMKPANPRVSDADIQLAQSINPLAAPYRACPNCGDTVPLTVSHCAVCGTQMPTLPSQVKAEPKYTPPHDEPTYHPVSMTPKQQPAKKIWRGEPAEFTAAIDLHGLMNGDIVKGERYRAVENENNMWIISPAGTDDLLGYLSSVSYFWVNPQAKEFDNPQEDASKARAPFPSQGTESQSTEQTTGTEQS